MSTGWKTKSCDHRGKMLKSSLRSLLKAIKRATKVTNHTLRDKVPSWWTHVNILTQLTIKKDILHIKLRDEPLSNRSHDRKSVNSSHMSNRNKSLIIITTMLLLKTTSNKTSLIALKRTVRASLNLIDPLTSDRMSTWRTGHKIQRARPLKSSNLLSHRVQPFRMKNNIAIRSWLRKSSGYESWRVTVRWPMKAVITSNKLLQRGISRRGGLNWRRWHILTERRRWHIRIELIRESWSIWQACSTMAIELSLEVSSCSPEQQEETQRKTQKKVKSSEE
jgi:hypothetical protein